MATISNGESGSSVRTKLNEIINKVEGVTSINNNIDVTGTVTADGLTVDGSGSVSVKIESTGANYSELNIKNTSANYTLGVRPDVSHALVIRDASNSANRASFATNGNISFYDSAGSSQSFFWDAAAESLGIGTTSPALTAGATGIDIYDSIDAQIRLHNSTSGTTASDGVLLSIASDASGYLYNYEAAPLIFGTSNAEAMRINSDGSVYWKPDGTTQAMTLDASGNLLVGKTTGGVSTDGFQAYAAGYATITDTSFSPLILNRKTSDGTILDLHKDGTTVGSIGTAGRPYFANNAGDSIMVGDNGLLPRTDTGAAQDDVMNLGGASDRWNDIYATNGTIQTSDQNEKQDIAELTEAEQRVAVAAKGLLRKFRWKDAVAEKGDEARTHFGIIAQDLQAAFAAEGLDAGDYAMFIHSTWTEEETGEERSRMGVRYSELLAFIIAAI